MNKQKKNQKYTGGGCSLTGNRAFFLRTILIVILSVLLCVAGLFSFNFNKLKSDAYDSSTLPSGNNAIGNLYDDVNNRFNRANLDALGAAAGYGDFRTMVLSAEGGMTIDASMFGEVTVGAGSYTTLQGNKADLVW